jgi:hypothetical protein
LETARLEHIDKIREQLAGSSGDSVIEGVNDLYAQEARSFYNYEKVGIQTVDPDVVKDYPMLLELVQNSGLPKEFKTAFVQNFKFIRYEEAGRLQNGLRGIDKNLGMTFAYVLRNDLAERAAADVEKLAAEKKQREEQQKAAEEATAKAAERLKIIARITLCLSLLAVLALVGWMLVLREVTNWQAWSNVLIVAAVVFGSWILVGLGVLTWISSYVGLAF